MRPWTIALALSVVAGFALAEEPPAGPTNLDFEQGATTRGVPKGWIGAPPAVLWDPTVAHAGEASARIRQAAVSASGMPAQISQWISATPWRGKRLRLGGWLRTDNVASGWAALWVRADSPTKPGLAFDNMEGHGVQGTTEWKRYEIVVAVPAEATDLYFGAMLAGTGTVWLDDVSLEEAPAAAKP